MLSVYLPIQMKGCNLCCVTFEVREVEVIWQRLLLSRKPAKLNMKSLNRVTTSDITFIPIFATAVNYYLLRLFMYFNKGAEGRTNVGLRNYRNM